MPKARKSRPLPADGPITSPLVLRYPDAMVALQISERQLANMVKSGQLRSSKVGRMRLIHMDSIRELLAKTASA